MNFVFLCGSLEPGRDGVGDYTGRLVSELRRRGHKCRIIALNDRYAGTSEANTQGSNEISDERLRLASSVGWSNRIKQAKQWLEDFTPDWISLQFVPYSFHSKGLSIRLGMRIKQLAPEAKWHVMFHELWIGMEEGSPIRHRFVGAMQRQIIRKLVRDLRPQIVHTQSGLYLSQLRNLGVPPHHLPLFGNIPVCTHEPATMTTGNTKSTHESGLKALRLVHFGTIRPNVPFANFAASLAAYGQVQKKEITLSLVGRAGQTAKAWKPVFESAGIRFVNHGEQATDEISRLLFEADIGMITTPIALAEKSGALAAMREHGLPVIAVTNPWTAIGIQHPSQPAGLFNFIESELAQLFDQMEKFEPCPNALEVIASRLTTDLVQSC
ncbi:hypothetical protein HQ447_18330 [bacterium]|nr:hypothetical protein [bacterium]